MDKSLLFLINRTWTLPALDWLMATVTDLAVWLPLLGAAGLGLAWKGAFRARSFLMITALTLALTDGLFTQFTKKWVGRPRPSEACLGVRTVRLERTRPAFLAVARAPHVRLSPAPAAPVAGTAFPSGPAMNTAAGATLACLYFGRAAWPVACVAVLVAYSRVYCGAHWPSDVVVSAALGSLFALAIARASQHAYRRFGPRLFPEWYGRHAELIPARGA